MTTIPRLVIGGTHSGVGKTTITTALIAALTRRGLRVQPFKVGPDFIDPGFHQCAGGRVSRNLDGWMLSRETNAGIFCRACADADLAIIEGVMGLFDGRSATSDGGSTAEMAKWLAAPVLLVADASATARSAAAVVRGFEDFDPALNVAGVLFNRIGGERHAAMLREAVEMYCRAIPAGSLPTDQGIALPSRHLGLRLAAETLTSETLDRLVEWVERHIDLDRLITLARANVAAVDAPSLSPAGEGRKVRIAVARDEAFCFYYQDNLDLLERSGAELVFFSPIRDAALPPDVSGIYLGGGYPELHAEALSANCTMRAAFREFVGAGTPVYAECGGFMYLTEAIAEPDGRSWPMAGIFPTTARMRTRLARLGYVEVETADGEHARGHQFRYSEIDPMPPHVSRLYEEGYQMGSAVGSYVHLHFLSCPDFARRFVDQCSAWREKESPR